MEYVLTVSLWLMPVAGVLALSTQEFIEDKVLEHKSSNKNMNNNTNSSNRSIDGMLYDLITFKNAMVFCQSYVCGCDSDVAVEDYYHATGDEKSILSIDNSMTTMANSSGSRASNAELL